MEICREIIEQPYTIQKRDFPHDSHIHWHSRMEVIYLLEGDCQVEMGQDLYCGKPGDMFIVHSGILHDIHPNPEHCVMYICTFDPLILTFLNEKPRILQEYITAEELRAKGMVKKLEEILEEILLEHQQGLKGHQILIQSGIIRLYSLLVRNFESSAPVLRRDPAKAELFQKALVYIAEHYSENISLQNLAGILNYSTAYVSVLFTTYTGMNFKVYLDSFRVNKSMKMLQDNTATIAEVATRCGYENIRTFNNTFKRITGMSPSDFKQSNL